MELKKLYMISLFKKYTYIENSRIEEIINKNLSLTETYLELKLLLKKPFNN